MRCEGPALSRPRGESVPSAGARDLPVWPRRNAFGTTIPMVKDEG